MNRRQAKKILTSTSKYWIDKLSTDNPRVAKAFKTILYKEDKKKIRDWMSKILKKNE